MGIQLPQIPEKDKIGKVSAFIQLVIFLVLFIGIYLVARRFVHAFFLRILILIADYFAVSMVTFLAIKPLSERLEEAIRRKKS